MIPSGRKPDAGKRLQEASRDAALLAVERLRDLLADPDASAADVLKAATLIFDKIYPAAAGGGPTGGDFEICVKEE